MPETIFLLLIFAVLLVTPMIMTKVQLNKSSDSNHSESELEEILKKKDKEISKLKDQLMSQESSDLFNSPEKIGSVDFYNVKTNCSPKDLRKLSDTFIDKNLSGLALITTANDDKIAFILRTQRDNKAINLSVITKNLFKSVDGSGGGKPDMSQGSFSVGDLDKFVDALKSQLN